MPPSDPTKSTWPEDSQIHQGPFGKLCAYPNLDTYTTNRLAGSSNFATAVHESAMPAPEAASEAAPEVTPKSQHKSQGKEGNEPAAQAQEPQPPQVYTTVGSLYNPQASQPLQAPTRRGRNIKWPPTLLSDPPRPALTKAMLSSLPYITNHHLTQSPPNDLHNLLHYSPLRQNFDRAVSPPSNGPVSALPVGQTRDTPSFAATTIPNILGDSSPGTIATAGFGKAGDTISRADEREEGEKDEESLGDDEALRRMNVRALRNLASYDNPMQRRAQKILSGVKPLPSANPRVQARPSPSYYEPTEPMDEQRGHVLSGRNTRSDPVAMTNILQQERTGGTQPLKFPPGLGYPHQGIAGFSGLQITREESPASILSRGPGAPQPLTAGPPGQRHYRASALESVMHGVQSSMRKNVEIEDQGLIPNPYNGQVLHGQTPITVDKESGLSFDTDTPSFTQDMLAFGNSKETTKPRYVVDTMCAEDVQVWYPEGLPAGFGRATTIVPKHWADDYPLDSTHEQRRKSNLKSHDARTREHFYSGTYMFNKTIAEASEERTRRIMHRTIGVGSEVGVIGGERRQSQSNAKIKVEDACRIPRHEHAEPLLSMAFQTFAKHVPLNAPF